MSNLSEQLEAIRKKFVGTGEEHDLLSKLTSEYRDAYDRGYSSGRQDLVDEKEANADALKFAHLLLGMNWHTRRFIEWCGPDDSYNIPPIVSWLKSIGKTPELLRELADAMEAVTEMPPVTPKP